MLPLDCFRNTNYYLGFEYQFPLRAILFLLLLWNAHLEDSDWSKCWWSGTRSPVAIAPCVLYKRILEIWMLLANHAWYGVRKLDVASWIPCEPSCRCHLAMCTTNWLTDAVELNSTPEPSSCEATWYFPCIVWSPKVHYLIHRSNPIHITPSYLYKIQLSVIQAASVANYY
jgi:hypothetical protein